MIQITPQMRILLATELVDFRKGIGGLAGVCKNILDKDPFTGYVFVFANTKRISIKILTYDGQVFCPGPFYSLKLKPFQSQIIGIRA